MEDAADSRDEKETGIRVQRRLVGDRVEPALGSPRSESSRSPAQVANRTAALEADLERLNATSQRLAAENDLLKTLEAKRAHEMTTISAALQSLTSAAESSRDRSESDKAAIKQLEAELRTALIRAQPAELTALSPAASARATDPLSPWSPPLRMLSCWTSCAFCAPRWRTQNE